MPQNKLVLSYPLSTVGQRAKYEINMYEMSKNPNCPNWNWCRDLYHLFNDSKIVCELILTFLINLLASFKSFTLTFSLCPTALYTTVPQGAHGDYLQTVPLPFGQHMSIFIKVLHVPCYEVDGTRCRHSLKTHHLDGEILETMVLKGNREIGIRRLWHCNALHLMVIAIFILTVVRQESPGAKPRPCHDW